MQPNYPQFEPGQMVRNVFGERLVVGAVHRVEATEAAEARSKTGL